MKAILWPSLMATLLLSVCVLHRDSDAFVSTVQRLQGSRPLEPWGELARWSRRLVHRQQSSRRTYLQLTAADGGEDAPRPALTREGLIAQLAAVRDKDELMTATSFFINDGASAGPWGADDIARVAGILDGVTFETTENVQRRMKRVLEKIDPQRAAARDAERARKDRDNRASLGHKERSKDERSKGPRGPAAGPMGPRKKERELMKEIDDAVAEGNLQTFSRSVKVRFRVAARAVATSLAPSLPRPPFQALSILPGIQVPSHKGGGPSMSPLLAAIKAHVATVLQGQGKLTSGSVADLMWSLGKVTLHAHLSVLDDCLLISLFLLSYFFRRRGTVGGVDAAGGPAAAAVPAAGALL
jgi:hypothetical protein